VQLGAISPSPAPREREGPVPQGWEGEGGAAGKTLTRLATLATLSRDAGKGQSGKLYAEHVKVYPQRVAGRFRRLKWLALALLLGLYYVAPWLRWPRGAGAPDQALLIDMPARRAWFFFIEIWPQEVYYLMALLIVGAIGLFFVTSLAGRVWCGFTCPQTVWTDLFMQVERWIEGDRNKRMRLDQAPLSLAKVARKLAKHAAWIAIALATGGAWIFYFNDAPTTLRALATGQASATVYGFIVLFSTTTYLLAGWAREQVCIYMCPWPRFQGAMFDEDTLLVTYEEWRGEPRRHVKAKPADEAAGDCIDCGLCVRVCPTGIDIRKGQQLACIGCALCVDACNEVMSKIGRPRDLITYDSLSNQAARAEGRPTRLHLVRPRTIVYAALLSIIVAAMAVLLLNRATLDVAVQPDRAPLFVRLSDGGIRNGYTLKIINKERGTQHFRLSLRGLREARLSVIGYPAEVGGEIVLPVAGDSVGTFTGFVQAPRASLAGESTPIDFTIAAVETNRTAHHASIFRGPAR
jgi:cytochrome c oxidase accessory protein FixG